jgi:hypothetical protein
METPAMKSSLATALQFVLALVALGALVFLLGEPHLEGRNAHATLFEIYFKDPFLAYVYTGSIAFFLALYRAFALLGNLKRSRTTSPATAEALRGIRRCAFTMLAFVAGGVVIILVFGDPDDRPAGVFMSFLFASFASAIAFTASRFERNLRRA